MAATKRLIDDLLNLEINTMVKAGMTGRKMPALGHALLDIFSAYDSWIGSHTDELNDQWSAFRDTDDARTFLTETIAAEDTAKWWVITQDPPHALIERLGIEPLFDPGAAVTAADFQDLRKRARTAEEMQGLLARHGRPIEDGADVMLRRIVRNCDQLTTILEKSSTAGRTATLSRSDPTGAENASAAELTSEDLITIRKAWEMGTEVIAMQTVVQLDGDIVNRVNSAFLSERRRPVRDLHRESVGNALSHWHFLVDTVSSVISAGLGKITG